MLRPFVATLAVAGIAAWVFSPAATGAPEPKPTAVESGDMVAPTPAAIDPTGVERHEVDVGDSASDIEARPPSSTRTESETVGAISGSTAPEAKRRRYPQSKEPPAWVLSAPEASTQRERSSRQRGINPCLSPDPGFGNYHHWDRSPSSGQMIVPKDLKLDADDSFPLIIHFHGHEAARKEWVQAVNDAVLVGIDLGNNSGPYLRKFADPAEFDRLLSSIEAGVAARLGVRRARIGRLGISSWSAGYGAVERALRSHLQARLDAVILLDGLHTGHADTPRAAKTLAPFVEQARRAAEGKTFMYVSHSSILPPTYASTTETASYLMWQLGGEPAPASTRDGDPMGLELVREYSDGDFLVRGFSGNGKLDHCAHLGLYRRVLREQLAPRWGLRLVAD